MTGFPSRLERFETIDSTQRVVAGWLASGTPEVAVAVADVQQQGRGRKGRSWTAPAGAALLMSIGFAPDWLAPSHAWRLGAIVALAMLDAAEDVAGLRDGTLGLKWPNDLVHEWPAPIDDEHGDLLKLAGVLGESTLRGERLATVVIGIGVNADWAAADFPRELAATMTSLREVSGGRPIDRDALLEGALTRLEARYEALRTGRFDSAAWSRRQRTTGREVEVAVGDATFRGVASGVDPDTGALLLESAGGTRVIDSGEVTRCRVVG